MLSVENPPSDSHLKTDDDDDENIKTSCSNIGAADLLNSNFDVNHNNFSIRDYVYSARSKDIATNWPFSEKNLQQFQKHGVKNLLPPFQRVDSVRFMSVNKCAVYDILADQAHQSNSKGKTRSQFGQDEQVSVSGTICNQKLNLEHLHITSSVRNQGEREVPSEVEQSHSGIDSEAVILLEPTTKQVEAGILPVTCKTDKISKPEPLVKKSRLMVKLGTLAGPSTKEDNMTSNFLVSEIMASKVCPVCKTFSSSSNTTLNAHIDQCLSGESTIKWAEEPKATKHRIKPRKTRLMRDIYATALHCTLEDLDRRNGTNWASNSTPPDQSNELCVEEKRLESLPSAAIEETGHKEGEVYIDTDGTKVRILSKFSEAANIQGDSRAQYILKSNKFITDKKKKKHQKTLKLVTRGKPCSSKPDRSFETRRYLAVEKSGEKDVQVGQCLKAQEQTKLDDSEIIRRWVGSKRTGLTEKSTLENKHQNPGQPLAKSYADGNCLLNKQQSFKKFVSSQTSKKMETSKNEPGVRLYMEQPPLGRKREFPWSSEGVGYRKRSMILPKHKKLRKEGTSMHDRCNNSSNHTSTRATSFSNKAAPTKTSDVLVVTSKSSCSHQEFSSKATKSTPTRTKLTNQVIVPNFRSDIKRNSSVPTRSQFKSQLDINDNFAWRPSQNDDDDSAEEFSNARSKMGENMGKMFHSQTEVLKNRGAINFPKEEDAADGLKNSTEEPCDYGHDVGEMKEFSPVNFCSALEDSEDSFDDEESESERSLAFGEDVAIKPTATVATGGFISCSNSLLSEFPKLPSSPEKSKSEQCAEVDQWDSCGNPTSPRDPSFRDKQVLFSADAVGNVMTEEFNYFSKVDPIPIPGPPGSFLPSLGPMGSDNFQGNLLNTSQVQSTEDQHDFVDIDKSDSPVSAVSDISNPTLAISKSISSKNFAVDIPLSAQDEIQRGFLGAAQVSQAVNLRAEHFNLDTSRINVTSFPEKAQVNSNFEQLRCWSREEGIQGAAFNLQESQLLSQQKMPYDSFLEMQMDNGCSERFGTTLNSRSGAFSFSNHPNSGPGKVVYPTRKFTSEQIDKNVSTENEVKFLAHKDFDSASPSASNPVLRLMGKNLMVVNKDEVPLLQHGQHQSSSMNVQPYLQRSTVSEVNRCVVSNKDYHSYHQVVTQNPMIVSQDQRQDAFGQKIDAKLSRNFEVNVDVETPQLAYHASRVNFPSKNVTDAFRSPSRQHDYKVGTNMSAEEGRPQNRLNNPLTYGLQEDVENSGVKHWGVGSTSSRDIIIIDDATNNEADSATGTMCHDGIGRIRVSSSRNATNSFSGASKFSSRCTTSYYRNPFEHAGSFYGGQPVMHNASFQMPVSEGINAGPVKWNCNSEGLSFLRPSSLSSPSTSVGHLRPTIYYSPSLS